ncbi:MAG TPA: LysM peptidoglycan-binding domain-containing protein [Bacillota bacterium]|nr:LysM peptidoglycan-binding domain-containing protein [Bacillota bacterium]
MELKKKLEQQVENNGEKPIVNPSKEGGENPPQGLPPRKKKQLKEEKTVPRKPKGGSSVAFVVLGIFLLMFGLWYIGGKSKAPSNKEDTLQGLEVNTAKETFSPSQNNEVQSARTGGEVPPVTGQQPQTQDSKSMEQTSSVEQTPTDPKEGSVQTESNEQTDINKAVQTRVIKHKVQTGDTLYKISLKYYHTGRYTDYLAKHNHLKSPSDLTVGKIIEVPEQPLE